MQKFEHSVILSDLFDYSFVPEHFITFFLQFLVNVLQLITEFDIVLNYFSSTQKNVSELSPVVYFFDRC